MSAPNGYSGALSTPDYRESGKCLCFIHAVFSRCDVEDCFPAKKNGVTPVSKKKQEGNQSKGPIPEFNNQSNWLDIKAFSVTDRLSYSA